MTVPPHDVDPETAYRGLIAAMRRQSRVLVAFSGGVDSGLVARIAHDALGRNALAVIADSESLPRRDFRDALSEAEEIGIGLRVVRLSELANPSYASNPSDRCYFCRAELATNLRPLASELGFAVIADGVNRSDLGEYRPGIRAMDEAGFWHPLVEFELAKGDVRALARHLGLSFADKPSNACLSSRIRYGDVITVERLRAIEAAEEAIRDLGFRVVRVRVHGEQARIEVPEGDLPRLLVPEVATRAVGAVEDAGFARVTVDPRGYRSGSMNEGL